MCDNAFSECRFAFFCFGYCNSEPNRTESQLNPLKAGKFWENRVLKVLRGRSLWRKQVSRPGGPVQLGGHVCNPEHMNRYPVFLLLTGTTDRTLLKALNRSRRKNSAIFCCFVWEFYKMWGFYMFLVSIFLPFKLSYLFVWPTCLQPSLIF